jgi:Asp-tRNA(Asn)/Glu-tRNA(Gln) amidotransferase B subunit
MTTEAYELPALPPETEPSEQWRRETRQATREAFRHYREVMGLSVDDMRMFTADQMREYARAAIQQERAKWVLSEMELADALGYPGPDSSGLSLLEFAAAIRAG